MPDFRRKLVINLAVVFIIVTALISLTLLLRVDINRRVNRIQGQKRELASRIQAVESLASLKNEYQEAKPYFDILKNILPTRDQMINFPKELNGLANQNKIDLGFSFGTEGFAAANDPGYINFIITAVGNYNNLFNFLKSIENSRYFVNFRSFDMSKKGQDYSSILTGQVYTQ